MSWAFMKENNAGAGLAFTQLEFHVCLLCLPAPIFWHLSTAHGDISWATTELHASVSCFLMFGSEKRMKHKKENSGDLVVHHFRNVLI